MDKGKCMPLLVSAFGFIASAILHFHYGSDFGAGVAFAVGLIWLGLWLLENS